jgi:hypothetical protein
VLVLAHKRCEMLVMPAADVPAVDRLEINESPLRNGIQNRCCGSTVWRQGGSPYEFAADLGEDRVTRSSATRSTPAVALHAMLRADATECDVNLLEVAAIVWNSYA